MRCCLRLLLLTFYLPTLLFAQNQPGSSIKIKKAKGEIVLDGVLDEADWKAAQVADNWYQNYPVDTIPAPFQTEARVTFDDEFFYVSFVCYDDESPDVIYSLRRDFEYLLNDNVGVNIGPYNDRLNGFFFALTPAGVQRDGIIIGGGAGGDAFNSYWDNKWYSEVVRYPDKWIAEMAIPFKSFRYKSDLKEWNIIFDRYDKKRNSRSSWIRTPIQYSTGMFAYSGQLVWEDPVPPPNVNISLIPYLSGNFSRDHESEPTSKQSELQAGFDAKVGITPSLNLDLTLNPDFSQVEVDQQVINLTRFEFRFPERRQFFLENSDLFSRAGIPAARPFFSRRIGLARDSSGLFQKVPILYGARLSGSLNEKWRLSMLNMQTKEDLSLGLPAQNFSVATVQRNFFRQSSLAITYVDKENLGIGMQDTITYYHPSIFKEVYENNSPVIKPNLFNRVLGADLELLSADNKWHGSFFLARSFDDFNENENFAGGAYLEYSGRNVYVQLQPSFVGENFNAEVGYVPSYNVYPGQINYKSEFNYKLYPHNNKSIIWMGPVVELMHTYVPDGPLADKDYGLGYSLNFSNTAVLELKYNYVFQRLMTDFSLIDQNLYRSFMAGETYDWQTVSVSFQSDSRQTFNFLLSSTYGGFYNGTNFNINGQLNYRYQPYGNVSLMVDYNGLDLAEGYGKEQLFLIGPRIDLTFTDQLFLTTYVQYNNLLDNVNLNARFQWRYQPASDFFIVYTENYFPGNFNSKNQALVFKLTYWLNI